MGLHCAQWIKRKAMTSASQRIPVSSPSYSAYDPDPCKEAVDIWNAWTPATHVETCMEFQAPWFGLA